MTLWITKGLPKPPSSRPLKISEITSPRALNNHHPSAFGSWWEKPIDKFVGKHIAAEGTSGRRSFPTHVYYS